MTLSDLPKNSMTRVAQSLCDSWASCQCYHCL